jgi:hypothetical protein
MGLGFSEEPVGLGLELEGGDGESDGESVGAVSGRTMTERTGTTGIRIRM